jgi:hypothetical protein
METETIIDASAEVGLGVIMEKAKYTMVSRYQNVYQNRYVKMTNRSFENVSKFIYI